MREACEGWQSVGNYSPCGHSTTATFGNRWRETSAVTSSGNCRRLDHTPRDNDLGLGSERMRSTLSCTERLEKSAARGQPVSGGVSSRGLRRSRSLSLGAERRYGEWARSSVQKLLRQDNWLGARSDPVVGISGTAGGYFSDCRGVEPDQISAGQRGSRPFSSSRTGEKFDNGFSKNLRHPKQVTQRRATPFATDADVLPVRSVGVRTGGGGRKGTESGSKEGSMRRGRRKATSVDRWVSPAAAVRVHESESAAPTREEACLASEDGKYGRREQIGLISGGNTVDKLGRGRFDKPEADDSRRDVEAGGWSLGEYGGGHLSPTFGWGDSSLPTRRERGKGYEAPL